MYTLHHLLVYFQTLLSPSLLNTHRGLIELVQQFLEHMHWERGKSDLARKVSFVSVRTFYWLANYCIYLLHFVGAYPLVFL